MKKTIQPTEPLSDYINQNGVMPGLQKLFQFRKALSIRNTPMLHSQDGKGKEAKVYVKIFDPLSSRIWFITEWVGNDECFGMIHDFEKEMGYFSLSELANVTGHMGIGLELDTHFKPTTRKIAEA